MSETDQALTTAAEIAEKVGSDLGESAIGYAIAKAIRALIR